MKIIAAISITAMLAISSVNATPRTDAGRLQSILACQMTANPERVEALIQRLEGVQLVGTTLSDAEYTIPNPVEVFGRPITRISIRRGANEDGEYAEYQSVFEGEFAQVARFAGVTADAEGYYRKQIGNNDLILRPEAGENYITCATGVRSFPKAIKRAIRNART